MAQANTILHGYTSNEPLAQAFTALQNHALSGGGLAIKAGSSAIAKTVSTIPFLAKGVFKSKVAGDVALTSVALSTIPALAGGVYQARLFLVALDASGTLKIVASPLVTGSSTSISVPIPDYDMSTYTPIGAIKVVNGSASVFTPGTTALDASDVTVTYFDLSSALPGQPL